MGKVYVLLYYLAALAAESGECDNVRTAPCVERFPASRFLVLVICLFAHVLPLDHLLRGEGLQRPPPRVHERLWRPARLLQPLPVHPRGERHVRDLRPRRLHGPPALCAEGRLLRLPALHGHERLRQVLPHDPRGRLLFSLLFTLLKILSNLYNSRILATLEFVQLSNTCNTRILATLKSFQLSNTCNSQIFPTLKYLRLSNLSNSYILDLSNLTAPLTQPLSCPPATRTPHPYYSTAETSA